MGFGDHIAHEHRPESTRWSVCLANDGDGIAPTVTRITGRIRQALSGITPNHSTNPSGFVQVVSPVLVFL